MSHQQEQHDHEHTVRYEVDILASIFTYRGLKLYLAWRTVTYFPLLHSTPLSKLSSPQPPPVAYSYIHPLPVIALLCTSTLNPSTPFSSLHSSPHPSLALAAPLTPSLYSLHNPSRSLTPSPVPVKPSIQSLPCAPNFLHSSTQQHLPPQFK